GKEVYGPIRNHVAKAAQQLKPLTALQLPLVVVLANPEGAMLDLSVQHVLSALYGNPTFTMDVDPAVGAAVGDGRLEFGRDGKLTNDHLTCPRLRFSAAGSTEPTGSARLPMRNAMDATLRACMRRPQRACRF